ncbi:MAG: M23 family metallopeptidase [Candidatus Aminicenantes bacterium]|nr:M23 family metallopeptidase [Candidatus Aminicenantes bacterium]
MYKKFFSLIIVPHSNRKFKTLTFSEKKVKTIAGITIFLIVLLVVFLVDYFSMNVTRMKYNRLLHVNKVQKEALDEYEKLGNKLEDMEKYTEKINVLAGLKSPEIMKELSIGNGNSDQSFEAPQNPLTPGVDMENLQLLRERAGIVGRNLNELVGFYENQKVLLASTPTIRPTNGWMTSTFGRRTDPFSGKTTFHWGIDIATAYGAPVVATADGVVAKASYEKIGGRTIIINHNWSGYQTVYCHLSKFNVKPGDKVKRWDIIGYVGKTGKASGPHVHYEVRRDGKRLNPYQFLLEEE